MAEQPVIMIAGGGTGGHLYPSLAVVDELCSLIPRLRAVYLGTDRPIDARVIARSNHELIPQRVQPYPKSMWRVPGFLLDWHASKRNCSRLFRSHRPFAVLGTGGYASGPPVAKAAAMGIPTAMLNVDVIPGRANRYLSKHTRQIFAQWADTTEYFNGARSKIEVTGCPVRPEFKSAKPADGIEHFGLMAGKKVLLVTGASLGAASINLAMICAARELGEAGLWDQWQVLHLTGDAQHALVEEAYEELGIPGRVVAFTRHMAAALSAADLVVSRAGASTLAEITALGKPAILMPYPHHKDRHQTANARVLVKNGAARLVPDLIDVEANVPGLTGALTKLMTDDAERERLAGAARKLGTAHAAETIAKRLAEMC